MSFYIVTTLLNLSMFLSHPVTHLTLTLAEEFSSFYRPSTRESSLKYNIPSNARNVFNTHTLVLSSANVFNTHPPMLNETSVCTEI